MLSTAIITDACAPQCRGCLKACAALRAAIGTPLPPAARAAYDHTVAAARAALGDEAFERAWAEGEALPLQQVIAQAHDLH